MPIPDIQTWWRGARQQIPGLPELPAQAMGAQGLQTAWEHMEPHRQSLLDLWRKSQDQPTPPQVPQGQAPPPGQSPSEQPAPAPAPPDQSGSALGQLIASMAGASRASTTPLAGLPTKIGDTNYSYFTSPVRDPNAVAMQVPITGTGADYQDPTPGAYAPGEATLQAGQTSATTGLYAGGTPYDTSTGVAPGDTAMPPSPGGAPQHISPQEMLAAAGGAPVAGSVPPEYYDLMNPLYDPRIWGSWYG